MDCPMHIPWTRTNKLKTTAAPVRPVATETLFKLLKDLLIKTLAPFPEAREALCLALIDFDRAMANTLPQGAVT